MQTWTFLNDVADSLLIINYKQDLKMISNTLNTVCDKRVNFSKAAFLISIE